jgi:hypothetical protein
MRMTMLMAAAVLASTPVLAQTTTTTMSRPHVTTSSRPLDNGPFTAEASRAYQGGGMVLEGAPGAPAPRPEPTPPGQTPRNMVQ